MKKLLSVVLSLAMLLSFGVIMSSAAENCTCWNADGTAAAAACDDCKAADATACDADNGCDVCEPSPTEFDAKYAEMQALDAKVGIGLFVSGAIGSDLKGWIEKAQARMDKRVKEVAAADYADAQKAYSENASVKKATDALIKAMNAWTTAMYDSAVAPDDAAKANKMLEEYKSFTLLALQQIQTASTTLLPGKVVKALGGNTIVNFFKWFWACILRFVFFGWAWMPKQPVSAGAAAPTIAEYTAAIAA